MKKNHLSRFAYWLLMAIFLATLSACDDIENINTQGSSSATTFSDDGGSNTLGSKAIPDTLISTQDSSATVNAAFAGIDLKDTLIDTNFSCYDHETTDYREPYITFAVSGNAFNSTQGSGRIDYDPQYGDFILMGGGFDSVADAYIGFDQYGQEFDIYINNNEYACFQHGASLERAFHRFLLNTPEAGDYTCQHVESTDQQIVRLEAGGVYSTAQGNGRYQYQDIVEYSGSEIVFTGGPLDGETVDYEENPTTGRQEFRISESQTFGIAVGASSSLSYVCAKLRTARPFKQYGYAAATQPARPSVSLSGLYYSPDILATTENSYLRTKYHNFRDDGFMRTRYPSVAGDDCNRTSPNGLNYCFSYDVVDGDLVIYNAAGRRLSPRPIKFASDGSISTISGDYTDLVTPSNTSTLEGIWRTSSYSQYGSGCNGLGGFCSYSFSSASIRLSGGGQFIRESSQFGGSSVGTPLGSTNAFSNAANDRSGTYEILGNRLILRYNNGDLENRFMYHTRANDLAIGGALYISD